MLKFNNEQTGKYKKSTITGTGSLAFRDLEFFARKNKADLSNVLDLGCGSGRSTNFLKKFCDEVNGCDINENALEHAKKSDPGSRFFLNNNETFYQFSKYKTIFSILMFFHLSSEKEIKSELLKCFNSLDEDGCLFIINGNKNLYTKNYASVQGQGIPPNQDGDLTKIKLLNIDCEVEDYYWSANFIITVAQSIGFIHLDTHMPLGVEGDPVDYKDETLHPPYYYIALKKNG